MNAPNSAKTFRRVLRTPKEHSAYLYFILESHEGLTSYSTLPHRVGELTRDVELLATEYFRQDVDALCVQLAREISVTDVTLLA